MDLEQSRYFFNYVLPDLILSNLMFINQFLNQIWWVFFTLFILVSIAFLRYFRKYINEREQFRNFDNFMNQLCSIKNLNKEEKFLLTEKKLLNIDYSALYQLRGDTYILIDSNIENSKEIAIPLRLSQRNLKTFKKSGKYFIYQIKNPTNNVLVIFFSKKQLELEKYEGHFNIMLSYYEKTMLTKNSDEENNENIETQTSLALMKLNIDKTQFFQFLISLILQATDAKGVRLLTKDNKLVFENIKESAPLQKTFYIRNTPYKLEFYDTTPLDFEHINQIGSFIDLSGSYVMNIDSGSEMVKNYLNLLKLTNQALELKSPYYKNHSKIVQIVSVEIAKSLFLSQEDIEAISLGAELHDIGMVGDLTSLLEKNKLENKEIDLIKKHPLIGGIMVEPISHIYNITDIIKYHHERFDGKGYPFGLEGFKIPLNAHIVALGEFYAGLTSDRAYRKGKTHEEAIEEIKKVSNIFFDESLIKGFLDVSNSIKIKLEKLKIEGSDEK